MNIKKIKETLLTYLKQNYDLADSNLLRKFEHTQVVANYSKEIAKENGLNADDQNLAYIIGLFHDYARFEQWTIYKTYNDKLSKDHADFAVELLFEKNQIQMFDIPEKYYEVLKTAVKEHNKFQINPSIVDERTLLFCKIIRDADKTNLYELNINGSLPTFTNFDGVSENVLKSVNAGECVNNIDVKTKLDRALLSLASTYDLNFSFSYKKLKDINYFEQMKVRFSPLLKEEDQIILSECIDTILKKISQRINN